MSDATSSHPEVALARDATELLELDRSECLRLLATASVGRIAVTVPGWPEPLIRPVNYLFDKGSQSVLIRSGIGSKLRALILSARAAFEIDDVDAVGRVGWSVIVHGVCEEITNPSELRRVTDLGLEPWPPGDKSHWIRIRVTTISGRRIVAVAGRQRGS